MTPSQRRAKRARAALAVAIMAFLGGTAPAAACLVAPDSAELRPVTRVDQDRVLTQGARYQPFYINQETLVIGGLNYVPYGLPRTLEPSDVTLAARYQGVPFFRAAGETEILPEVFYFLYDPETCQFQPYQVAVETGG